MDSMTFASSQKQERRLCRAERRWENEGGNPGQLQRLPCDDQKEDATTGPAQAAFKALRYKIDRNMHLIQFHEIMRDAEVAHAINPIVRRCPLSVKDTTKASIACGVPRATYVAQIASALK